MRSFLAGVALALASCATRPDRAAQPTAARTEAPPASPFSPPRAATSSVPARELRRLPAGATFADLVEAAGLLDAAAAGRSEAGCLLQDGDRLRLEADLLLAAHPLPRPEPGLTTQLEEQIGAPVVISAWGTSSRDGGANSQAAPRSAAADTEPAGMVLLAFTTTTPSSARLPAIALFATRAGTFVRADDVPLRAQRDALPVASAAARLAQVAGEAVVYVTADPDLPVSDLLQLLRAIPHRLETALAVALPKTTRLPPLAADTREALCPDGLPAPSDEAPEGELTAEAAQAAFAPLRDAALACALTTGGRALLGGRLVLGVRIGADGKAGEACFIRDAIGEPLLRRCLVSAARDLRLPPPSPAGFVDLHAPLEIRLDGPSPQRASCE